LLGAGCDLAHSATFFARLDRTAVNKAFGGHKRPSSDQRQRRSGTTGRLVVHPRRSHDVQDLAADGRSQDPPAHRRKPVYDAIGAEYAKHETANHGAKKYVRGGVVTNTGEGYVGVFKRGMVGVTR
jgi:hypothetical protein